MELPLAELLACLAAACELAMGQDADFALHSAAVAQRLAKAAGLTIQAQDEAWQIAQLRFIGCNAETDRMAAVAGDVIELRRAVAPLDTQDTRALLGALLDRIAVAHAGEPAWRRWLAQVRGVAQSEAFVGEIFPGHCEVARRLSERLGLAPRVQQGLSQLYARWDGRGVPALQGEAVLPAVRVVTLAQEALLHHRRGGWPAVQALLAARRGRQFDPQLVDRLLTLGAAALEPPSPSEATGSRTQTLRGPALEEALQALADYTDLQSPWLLQHSRRVAALAEGAARRLGLPDAQQALLRHAGWLHDIGRVAISADLWGQARPLTPAQRDRMHLHSHLSQQVLARSPTLAELARLTGLAHERLDGSGYLRGLTGTQLDGPARVLAAADVIAALGEARPYRPAFSADQIEAEVQREIAAGRLDETAARAVLAEAGMKAPRRTLPRGITPREAEVLALLARGQTNKQIARQLGLSPKTVGRHLENLYAKAGVSTRAGATLFAVEQHLL